MNKIYNHQTTSLSEIDMRMVRSIPMGGNWKNIPKSIPSLRLDKIRLSGGRTTYYGRLRWEKPAYTISTYFNRPGNGCFIHPDDSSSKYPQHRLISFREAARLQSFKDDFKFYGSKTSIFKQIGNAVPPLLAYFIARKLNVKNGIDLFCGCGGLSNGFEMSGTKIILGSDINKHFLETWKNNHKGEAILGDIQNKNVKKLIIKKTQISLNNKELDIIIGGPPCQGFSTAGWRIENDERNLLWKEYLDLVKNLKPKYFLIENVMGLLSSQNKSKKVIDNIKDAFNEIGYKFQFTKLESQMFGVPQIRKRIFILGSRNNIKMPEYPTPFVKKYLSVQDAIKGFPKLRANDGQFEQIGTIKNTSAYNLWLSNKISIQDLEVYLKKNHS